ncbi:MAG: hypothetical protein E6H79_07500 [Betaproteobacteria bacterium]|nr:MAG: hypothetical protein E6H79_07500 [Betaproteobacteria bacterium]
MMRSPAAARHRRASIRWARGWGKCCWIWPSPCRRRSPLDCEDTIMTSDTTTTLGAALSEAAHRWGDAPFILHGDAVTSYAELEHASRRAAAGLMRLGLEPGDRIGLLAPNRIEWLILFFAAG